MRSYYLPVPFSSDSAKSLLRGEEYIAAMDLQRAPATALELALELQEEHQTHRGPNWPERLEVQVGIAIPMSGVPMAPGEIPSASEIPFAGIPLYREDTDQDCWFYAYQNQDPPVVAPMADVLRAGAEQDPDFLDTLCRPGYSAEVEQHLYSLITRCSAEAAVAEAAAVAPPV